jgi:hypothetical protein
MREIWALVGAVWGNLGLLLCQRECAPVLASGILGTRFTSYYGWRMVMGTNRSGKRRYARIRRAKKNLETRERKAAAAGPTSKVQSPRSKEAGSKSTAAAPKAKVPKAKVEGSKSKP